MSEYVRLFADVGFLVAVYFLALSINRVHSRLSALVDILHRRILVLETLARYDLHGEDRKVKSQIDCLQGEFRETLYGR